MRFFFVFEEEDGDPPRDGFFTTLGRWTAPAAALGRALAIVPGRIPDKLKAMDSACFLCADQIILKTQKCSF
jgi:hypothetical protein